MKIWKVVGEKTQNKSCKTRQDNEYSIEKNDPVDKNVFFFLYFVA